ncbi:helix-turn-helix protein [Barrientosiimonas humi]|uniref:Helix-turn-helix protein n=1 Tax=Barrientosiimonas humi TaxID=999931 RepID=A0A542X998_9MICO|nr:helix-turn-helix domain-containing protein [Barrientosiimonas humi]TQL32417.1 helix-turn-helix protein [Barrientosiimonas humi]CAG7572408.1 hypothetical protein BH39T_PBIAJDOK_01023 [Barrientosiimonas humi]
MAKREERELSTVRPDATALKALAHPARLRMLGMLRTDGPATASQLAERMGLNSGATSYHLRQLEQYGFVKEDSARGNKRDRWWRAAHQSTRTRPGDYDDLDDRAAYAAYRRTVVGQHVATMQSAAAEFDDLPREWAEASTESDWSIWLTPEQSREVVRKLGEVLEEAMDLEAPEGERPADAEIFSLLLHAFPAPGRVAQPGDES